jgi:hypothetical protein
MAAHERIDRARKSNAKPVEETFVFPLTVETRFLQGDASAPEYLPCRSDEIDSETDPLGDLNKMPVGEFYARLAASQEKTRQFLANVPRSLPTDNPEGC